MHLWKKVKREDLSVASQCVWETVRKEEVMLKDGTGHLSGSCAGCPDMYWFAYAADPPAERHRRGLWAQQVDELASPEQELNGATSAQKESPCSPLGMSGCAPHLHQKAPLPSHARACWPNPLGWSTRCCKLAHGPSGWSTLVQLVFSCILELLGAAGRMGPRVSYVSCSLIYFGLPVLLNSISVSALPVVFLIFHIKKFTGTVKALFKLSYILWPQKPDCACQ